MRPLVAVPAYVLRAGRVSGWEDGATGVPDAYTTALLRAGVRPGMLALADDGGAEEVLEPFAGLVLIGGGDVSPDRYAGARHPQVYGVEADRDELELALAREAVRAQLPILAICRGLRSSTSLSVGRCSSTSPIWPESMPTAGRQPMARPPSMPCRSRPAAGWPRRSAVRFLPPCTSIHHQAADRVAPGLVATAHSDDGLIEALETEPGDGWVLAVQWHPERTAAGAPRQQAIFDAFASVVRAAR